MTRYASPHHTPPPERAGTGGIRVADPAGAQLVPYGQSIWLEGEILCRSGETGMSCEIVPSGHGFSLSRADLQLHRAARCRRA